MNQAMLETAVYIANLFFLTDDALAIISRDDYTTQEVAGGKSGYNGGCCSNTKCVSVWISILSIYQMFEFTCLKINFWFRLALGSASFRLENRLPVPEHQN